MNGRRFVILDRDGTIINGVQPYVLHPDQVSLLPGAADGLRALQSLGLGLVMATNQAVVAKGILDNDRLVQIQRRLFSLLEQHGIRVEGAYICTHHPDENCQCRKPRPGLVERAATDLGFDPRHSFVVGDDIKDIELGRVIGATTILVRTGHGRLFENSAHAHYVADDLPAVAAIIQKLVQSETRSVVPVVQSRSHTEIVEGHLKASARVQEQSTQLSSRIVATAQIIADSFRKGGKLLLCGNGGSAADCQHIAAEFTNILDRAFDRGPLPAIALTTDTSFLTSFMNDSKRFEEIFSRQVEALGRPGDVLMGLSTSGTSANVIRALETARNMGISTIALTGAGGELAKIANIAISVPSTNTSYIQEVHLSIEHAICDIVERELYRGLRV